MSYDLSKQLTAGCAVHIPKEYPDGMPLYWRFEASGILADAVHQFLSDAPIAQQELNLLREYVAHWVNAPVPWHFTTVPKSEFIRRLDRARSREDLWTILHELLVAGIDPL